MVKVNSYARFSPRPNADKCESCERQLEDIRKWIEVRGHESAEEFSDEALSGDALEKRPGLLDALKATKRGQILAVRSLDRLFRETREALDFMYLLTLKGATLVSITEESACDNSPIGDFLKELLLSIGRMQRRLSNARTKARMLQHQANGRKMGKNPPYGSVCKGKRLVSNPYEQKIMKRILTLRVEGHGQRKICQILTDERWRPRGLRWRTETIARILRRFPEIEEVRVKTNATLNPDANGQQNKKDCK